MRGGARQPLIREAKEVRTQLAAGVGSSLGQQADLRHKYRLGGGSLLSWADGNGQEKDVGGKEVLLGPVPVCKRNLMIQI
jgi:hypothetical protein